jgi:hypothetical protein
MRRTKQRPVRRRIFAARRIGEERVQKALISLVIALSFFIPTTAHAQELPPVPSTIDYVAATRYYLRTLPPQEMLRAVLGSDIAYNRLAPKITGESKWNCGINNRTSSAAGLGQTIFSQNRVNFLASHWLGPFEWSEVRGPDCLADVVLIAQLYSSCGLGDWTPPYDCLRPIY